MESDASSSFNGSLSALSRSGKFWLMKCAKKAETPPTTF